MPIINWKDQLFGVSIELSVTQQWKLVIYHCTQQSYKHNVEQKRAEPTVWHHSQNVNEKGNYASTSQDIAYAL